MNSPQALTDDNNKAGTPPWLAPSRIPNDKWSAHAGCYTRQTEGNLALNTSFRQDYCS